MPLQVDEKEIERIQAEQRARWEDLRTRRGHFQISVDLLRLSDDSIYLVFEKMIVTRCEYMFDRDLFDYHALSPRFESIPDSVMAPDYTFQFHSTDGKIDEIKVIRLP